jgi:hypothetical protein
MWMEMKVIFDIVLTVGGITLGVIFVRKVCQIANFLSHMAGAMYTIDTCIQPDTLRRVLDKALRGGPTFLEDQIAQYVTPEQRCPGLRKEATEHGPEEDYDNEPVGGCMADWAQGEKEAWDKAEAARKDLEKKARELLTGGEF